MPYVVPVQSFIDYMKTAVVKRVIDANITTIFLEEPEFWARAGYSAPFKEEWQKYYERSEFSDSDSISNEIEDFAEEEKTEYITTNLMT